LVLIPSLVPAVVYAAPTTVVVRESNKQGWVFNGDPSTSTPYNFTSDQHSIGYGSLYVPPISATAADKFIAAKTLAVPTADLNSVAYDFLIAGNGTNASKDQYYLNIYTNQPSSATYYDCRFDYVPASGSTGSFTTALFNAGDTPVNVRTRPGAPACPATLAGMPAGSTVSFIALNVGDTSASDAGLAGYLDKVVVSTTSKTTTYDFEPELTYPVHRSDCEGDNWMVWTGKNFKNRAACINYVTNHAYELSGDARYTAYGLERRVVITHMDTLYNRGTLEYSDKDGNYYSVDISEVRVSGKTAWFAGKVHDASNMLWNGLWLFGKVQDGKPDMIWGSFTDEANAVNGAKSMGTPSDGPFNVTKGNLKISKF
jgi:hypothetical protein